MKFTLSWLKQHLDTDAALPEVVQAMTMAGLEVEHVADPAERLAAFSVARIAAAARHPDADRLQVCQVETRDGMKEIVCGAPNARAGLVTIYAPVGAYVPGLGVTLEARPVRGVVSNGMLCSAAELQVAEESDGIMELDPALAVGTPAAEALGLDAAVDFEVTPNRPDWLGVRGIARDLAAAGLGRLVPAPVDPVPGRFPCPVQVRLSSPDACPLFAGRLVRGVRNGPSPAWLQARLTAIGLRPISALVDVTNLMAYDRCRPLHVFDAGKLKGAVLDVRLGREGETLLGLDGRVHALGPEMCVIADGSGAISLGGVMGGEETGCSDGTVDVFIESAWFDPIRTAQTGRATGVVSDAQYRFARGVDPGFVVEGLELATRLVLDLCGGEPSDIVVAGAPPAPPAAVDFDPAYVERLSGLAVPAERSLSVLEALGFVPEKPSKTPESPAKSLRVRPPTWRRDVEGKADLVEEVARIVGYGALPATPLPPVPPAVGGVLTPLQARARTARRALAAMGYSEAVTWSFMARAKAELFGGGSENLILSNPIAADLDCMRPSILPNLIEAAGRNARQGRPDVALFEIGPVYRGDGVGDQRLVAAGLLAPHPPRRWDGAAPDALFELKADLLDLLEEIGVPTGPLTLLSGAPSPTWSPGRSAALGLGPKNRLAEFGELHPAVLKALDAQGPMLAFELDLGAAPEPKRRATKTRPAFEKLALMPLSRDFAFVVEAQVAAGDLVRAVQGADKALIASARVFDLYEGPGVPEGHKSLAVEVLIQPRGKTLTEAEIEALSGRIVAAAGKLGARLRS